MNLDEAALQNFLSHELGVDASNITCDTHLFSSGLVDSFALVTLMSYIENETGIMIPPTDITLENFDSLARILSYLTATASAA